MTDIESKTLPCPKCGGILAHTCEHSEVRLDPPKEFIDRHHEELLLEQQDNAKEKKDETVKSKFKIGPCETTGGYEVVIFEVSDKIYGKYRRRTDAKWTPDDWQLDGYYRDGYAGVFDLEPNNVSDVWEVEGYFATKLSETYGCIIHEALLKFYGKRVRVTVMEIDEEIGWIEK